MMSSVDDDFCDNEASPDRITVHMELDYSENDEEEGDLLPQSNPSIESTSNEDVSYIGLLKYHKEYRWYLLSSLVTDAGE